MLYPIATLSDETEITASRPLEDGSIIVHIEKWNPSINDFSFFQVKLPQNEVVDQYKYPKEDYIKLLQHIFNLSSIIIEYVTEQEEQKNNIHKTEVDINA